jgi:hypothetical protein
MRKIVTNPAVYMPTVIVLVTMAIWVTFNGLGPAWERRQHERQMARLLAWTPEPWAVTVDDFPVGTASELPAEERWLSTGMNGSVGVDPWRVAGLEHVLDALPFDASWRMARTYGTETDVWALNGVTVGDTAVFSFAVHQAGRSMADNERVTLAGHHKWLTHLDEDASRRGEGVVAYELIGDRFIKDERRRLGSAPFRSGELGYYGNRVVAIDDPTGEHLETVGVATVVDDAFIAVGTVTPVGVEPDANAVELLELLADKVRADPPEVAAAVAN